MKVKYSSMCFTRLERLKEYLESKGFKCRQRLIIDDLTVIIKKKDRILLDKFVDEFKNKVD